MSKTMTGAMTGGERLGEAGQAAHLTLAVPEGSGSQASATVSVNALGLVDLPELIQKAP
jgi:hypothetical protein